MWGEIRIEKGKIKGTDRDGTGGLIIGDENSSPRGAQGASLWDSSNLDSN